MATAAGMGGLVNLTKCVDYMVRRNPSLCFSVVSRKRRGLQLYFSSSSCDDSMHSYLKLKDKELMGQCEMNTFKASGPGGEHRNKRESAVRLKHLPTGIIAQAVEDRSQHKNRASALSHLRPLIALKGMQALLDLIYAVEGFVSELAKLLGMSTGALSRLTLSDDSLWKAVNELRTAKGMKLLK